MSGLQGFILGMATGVCAVALAVTYRLRKGGA
jgi:hypothetical protein